ncbi:MAG: GLPGLI family protein [Oceanihabitans sp.]
MNVSKTCIAICITLFTVAFSFAQQDFQGKAFYQSKTTMDLGNFGGREMSPERKKMIMERMKSFLEKSFTLTFNKSESIYKEEEQLATPGKGKGFGGMMGSFTGGAQYKNVKDNSLLQEQDFFGKQFLIKDSLPKLNWKLTGETKQIGKYLCMKATAVKPVDQMDWRSMRRKGKKEENKEEEEANKEADTTKKASTNLLEEIEIPKEIEVTAWYTMQIPVNQGPGEYWGLPGLILEVSADRTTILCSKIVLNPAEKETIKVPSKGKKVTKKEYNEIVMKKMEEMREMYGGRRGKNGRGGKR